MSITPEQVLSAAVRWGLGDVATPVAAPLAAYGNLLQHWNSRLSLTSIRDEQELIERHVMEGLLAAAHHPPAATVLDFGSGTGIPGLPIALCHPGLRVTLAESQRKKASFLREAVRTLHSTAIVHGDRAETLPAGSFDAVWMRAVDQSASMLPLAAALVAPSGVLCRLTTRAAQADIAALGGDWVGQLIPFLGETSRVLHIARRL